MFFLFVAYPYFKLQCRCTELLLCLWFDSETIRDDLIKSDYFIRIREIWNLFVTNCLRYYKPDYNVTRSFYHFPICETLIFYFLISKLAYSLSRCSFEQFGEIWGLYFCKEHYCERKFVEHTFNKWHRNKPVIATSFIAIIIMNRLRNFSNIIES